MNKTKILLPCLAFLFLLSGSVYGENSEILLQCESYRKSLPLDHLFKVDLNERTIVDKGFYNNNLRSNIYKIVNYDSNHVEALYLDKQNWKFHLYVNRVTGYFTHQLHCDDKNIIDKAKCFDAISNFFQLSEGICKIAKRIF
jgi:hypothetical protein